MNEIYSYGNNGNLTNIYGIYDIYSNSSSHEFFDKINYLLDKVDEISSIELTNRYKQTQIENERELNDAVNSKYSYYKNKEPRSVNGSGLKMKKQFRFNRK